jgi:hypothetical protein
LAKYFRSMGLFAGIGSAAEGIIFTLFFNSSLGLGVGTIIGGIFFLIAHIYGVVIFFYLVLPYVSPKKIITVGLILVALATIYSIKSLPLPKIDEKGIIQFNLPLSLRTIFLLFSTAGLLPLSIAFVLEAIKKKNLRSRSGFAAFALLFLAIANGLQSIVGPQFYILSYLILPTIAYIMLFIAVILRIKTSSS